jgi:hypothetical protein
LGDFGGVEHLEEGLQGAGVGLFGGEGFEPLGVVAFGPVRREAEHLFVEPRGAVAKHREPPEHEHPLARARPVDHHGHPREALLGEGLRPKGAHGPLRQRVLQVELHGLGHQRVDGVQNHRARRRGGPPLAFGHLRRPRRSQRVDGRAPGGVVGVPRVHAGHDEGVVGLR